MRGISTSPYLASIPQKPKTTKNVPRPKRFEILGLIQRRKQNVDAVEIRFVHMTIQKELQVLQGKKNGGQEDKPRFVRGSTRPFWGFVFCWGRALGLHAIHGPVETTEQE